MGDKDYLIGHAFRIPCKINETTVNSLDVLKNYLEPIGIKAELRQEDTDGCIYFEIDVKKYMRVVKRNAGRKSDTKMTMRYKKCKVSELKMKLQTMKRNEIIVELGCPKSTFYRILKNVNFNNTRIQNKQIWDFTNENKF